MKNTLQTKHQPSTQMTAEHYLHDETQILKVKDHSDLLAAQYFLKAHNASHPYHFLNESCSNNLHLMKNTLQTKHQPSTQQFQYLTNLDQTALIMKSLHRTVVTEADRGYMPRPMGTANSSSQIPQSSNI